MTRPSTRILAPLCCALVALAACSSASERNGSNAPAASTTTEAVVSTTAPAEISPVGDYPVGRRDVTYVDTTRGTDGNPDQDIAPASTRTLPVMVLYPTTRAAGATAGKGAIAQDGPVAEGTFPLIVFSHGVTASGPAYAGLLQLIAAHGYIVAAPTYPLTSGPGGWANVVQATNQPADVSFVIDQLLAESAKPTGVFSGRIAPEHVGIGGHSLGAITSLGFYNSCCGDPRVAAVVGLSGILFPMGGTYDKTPDTPLLLIHGEKDEILSFEAGSQKIFHDFTEVPRALIRYPAAGHVDVVAAADYTPLTVAAMNAFYDLELRGDDRGWRTISDLVSRDGLGSVEVAGGLEPAS